MGYFVDPSPKCAVPPLCIAETPNGALCCYGRGEGEPGLTDLVLGWDTKQNTCTIAQHEEREYVPRYVFPSRYFQSGLITGKFGGLIHCNGNENVASRPVFSPESSATGPIKRKGRMTSGNLGAGRARTRLSPEQVAEELAELIRELHELLGSYAPLWYAEDLDTRVRNALTKFTLSKNPSQETKPSE
jgi:hypothetical protein